VEKAGKKKRKKEMISGTSAMKTLVEKGKEESSSILLFVWWQFFRSHNIVFSVCPTCGQAIFSHCITPSQLSFSTF
jgi:hypothetical protein